MLGKEEIAQPAKKLLTIQRFPLFPKAGLVVGLRPGRFLKVAEKLVKMAVGVVGQGQRVVGCRKLDTPLIALTRKAAL